MGEHLSHLGLGFIFYSCCSTAVTAIIQVTGLAYNLVWILAWIMLHMRQQQAEIYFVKVNEVYQLKILPHLGSSDCQGFWNPHRLLVGYRWARVWVQIPVPASYKMSSRTSKTDKNWWRYGQNGRKHHLAHISVISHPFWLIFGGKTRGVAGKGLWGRGTGTLRKPQGYP